MLDCGPSVSLYILSIYSQSPLVTNSANNEMWTSKIKPLKPLIDHHLKFVATMYIIFNSLSPFGIQNGILVIVETKNYYTCLIIASWYIINIYKLLCVKCLANVFFNPLLPMMLYGITDSHIISISLCVAAWKRFISLPKNTIFYETKVLYFERSFQLC